MSDIITGRALKRGGSDIQPIHFSLANPALAQTNLTHTRKHTHTHARTHIRFDLLLIHAEGEDI